MIGSLLRLRRFTARRSLTPLLMLAVTGQSLLGQTWVDLTANLPNAPKVGVGQSLASDGTSIHVLASTNGVLGSTDNGNTWSSFNSVSGGGYNLSQIGSRSIDSTGTTLWAGGEPGGTGFPPLHRTTTPAAWTPSFAGATPPAAIDAVAYDSSTNTHWAAGRLGGIFKSTDGGSTWATANGNLPGTNCASIVARNGRVIAAITGGGMGAFTSTDGGVTWKNNGVSLPQIGFLTAIGDQVCVIGTGDSSLTSGIYFSKDFGLGWQFSQVDTAAGLKLLVNTCTDGATLFSGGTELVSNIPKVAFSLNGGTTWDDVAATGLPTGAGKQVEHLCRHGNFLFALTGDNKLYRLDLTSVTLTPTLKIAVHPKIDKKLTGGTLTMKTYAGGPGTLTYQWKKGITDIPGQTSDTLAIPNAQPADSNNYTCVVTAGGNSVTSNSARGTVVSRADGKYDPTYDRTNMAGGETGTPFLQAGGGLVVPTTGGVYRLGPDGGKTDSRTISAAGTGGRIVDSCGRVVLGGGSSTSNQRVRRLLGTPGFPDDPGFPLLATNQNISGITEQPGVGYLIFGVFTGISPYTPLSYVTVPKIARINYSGIIDTTFNTNVTATLGAQGGVTPNQVHVDGGGAIWLIYTDRVLKFTSSGTAAAGFTNYIGATSAAYVSASKILSTGKLLVTLGNSGSRALKLMKSDGIFDTTFNTANATLPLPFTVGTEQANGKIILGGSFTAYGLNTCSGYMRIGADGVFDDTFYCASGFNTVGCSGLVYDPRGYLFMANSANNATTGTFQNSSTVGDTIGQNFVRVFATAAPASGISFATWASGISFPSGEGGPNDDPDHDGLSNLQEFAFATSPLSGAGTQNPTVGTPVTAGPDTYPIISFTRRTDATGIALTVAADDTLPFGTGYGTTLVSTTPSGAGIEQVTYRSNVSLAVDPSQFLRVAVSEIP